MTPPPRLAVVVLSFNGREDTLRCLEALRGEVGPGDGVLVVDNGSADGSAAAVREAHPWTEVLETGANLGYAGGNNAGIRLALERGFPWVLLLNNDAFPEPGALEALLAGAEGAGAGAAQPLLLREGDPPLVDSLGLRPLRSLGVEDAGQGLPAPAAPAGTVEIAGPCGAAALYAAGALREAGLLDEEFFLLCEDLDLALRVRATGRTAVLVPAARVRHRRGVSGAPASPEAARRRKYWLQRNTVAVALRHWPPGALLLSLPLLLWRMAGALLRSEADPAHPCLPLWGRCLRDRKRTRPALARAGADRWFA